MLYNYYAFKQGDDRKKHLDHLIEATQRRIRGHNYYLVKGKFVCREYFRRGVMGCIGVNTLKRALRRIHLKEMFIIPTVYNMNGWKARELRGFLLNWMENCDPSPVGEQLFVPTGWTRNDIYQRYICLHEKLHSMAVSPLSQSHFYAVFKEFAKEKHLCFCSLGKITKCAICVAAKNIKVDKTFDTDYKAKVIDEHVGHLNLAG